jgi:PAS domain S-box-containing protein
VEEALRDSEERFRSLVETAHDAIVSADTQGKIVSFNPAAERIFGYSKEEALGQRLTLLMPERFHQPHWQGLRRFLVASQARVVGTTVEMVGRRKDGTEFPAELSLASWKSKDCTFFTGIITDITERKKAEDAVRERSAQLQAANDELEAFSYSVSHDLRAPLRAIDGFSQAFLEDYGERVDETGKDYLRRVRAATQRMGTLIDDLLDLSRVTRAEMRRETIDLSALANSVVADLSRIQPSRQVEFVIADGLKVEGDSRLLRLVLENLLGNAWKFTARRSHARIEFHSVERDGQTAYCVRDNGAGFDPGYAQRLFGAFQRLHTVAEFPGTGIGLATVQRIVHRHGGRVWAEGEPEAGASFYFTL